MDIDEPADEIVGDAVAVGIDDHAGSSRSQLSPRGAADFPVNTVPVTDIEHSVIVGLYFRIH